MTNIVKFKEEKNYYLLRETLMNFNEIFGKMKLKMLLKETKKQSFTLSSDSIFFEIYSVIKAWFF